MKKALLLSAFAIALAFASFARDNNTTTSQSFANKKAPLSFMENKGQIVDQNYQPRPDIQFQLKATNGLTIFVGDGAIHYQFAKAADSYRHLPEPRKPEDRFDPKQMMEHDSTTYTLYRMDVELIGANKHATIITEDKQDYYENYYTTGTGENGATVYAYSQITYKDIYPHIDWVLYTKNNELKHEFIVRKGGNPADIKLKYGGATHLNLQNDGSLEATTPQGTITEQAPVSYTQEGQQVKSSFSLKENELSYEVGNYEGTLVIDPSLVWATYFGAAQADIAYGITTDGNGNVYVTGITSSIAGIATTGSFQTTNLGGSDAYIAKFNKAGILQWSTFFGGTDSENGYGIVSGNNGKIYITGSTYSNSGIATSGTYQTVYGGGSGDAFVTQFETNGSRSWTTYYGGAGNEIAYNIAIDINGDVYITGRTYSPSNIATIGAYQTSIASNYSDAFLAKFDATGNIIWGTYFGGTANETGYGINCDDSSNIYLVGSTFSSSGISTSGSYQPNYGGNYGDAFISKFNASGNLLWATYYGSNLGNDIAYDVVTDNSGYIYIDGYTNGNDSILATPGAYQASNAGLADAFIAKFSNNGNRIWSTYFGGTNNDAVYSIAKNSNGKIYVTGYTQSTIGLATVGAYQPNYVSCDDAIFAEFSSSTGNKLWATYFSGVSDGDYAKDVTIDNNDYVYICGQTNRINGIATVNANQYTNAGSTDAFIAKFGDCTPFTFSSGNDTSVCPGSSVLLNATFNGSISWLGGVVNNQPFIPSYTNYVAVASDVNGCFETDTVHVIVLSLPIVTANASQNICSGQSITLNGGGASTYQWSNGVVNGVAFTPTTTTTYFVTGIDSNGCMNYANTTVSVNPLPTPAVNKTANTLSLSGGPYATYYWLMNNQPIPAATNATYFVTQNGDYKAIVSTIEGCTATSPGIFVTTVGINDVNTGNGISMYPNPVSEILVVMIDSREKNAGGSIEVLDVLGKVIASTSLGNRTSATSIIQVEMSTENWSSGVYFISYKDSEGRTGTVKVVKE